MAWLWWRGAVFLACCSAVAQEPAPLPAKRAAVVDAAQESRGIPGVSVAVAMGGRLAYAEGRTTLENGCDQPVLVDQSVVRPTGRHATGIVPAGVTTSLKDLSWFTLGYEGQIYKVVAVVAEPDHPEVSETGTLQAEQPVAETPAPVDTALP